MATRPVFVPETESVAYVREVPVEFGWSPGLAVSQKQKSIDALHDAARRHLRVQSILEISTKSKFALGVQLSAFNLRLPLKDGRRVPVEVAYQGSKEFERGGPFVDLLDRAAGEAKGDERLSESGRLQRFRFRDEVWPLEPPTAFYDWLYLNALRANPALADQLTRFEAFTDIEFNPSRSINCQARSAALYAALLQRGLLDRALISAEAFRRLLTIAGGREVQKSLF